MLKIFIVIFITISPSIIQGNPAVKSDNWLPSYYKCERKPEDVIVYHGTQSAPAVVGIATGELSLETSIDKVISCIIVTDVNNHHGYVAVSEEEGGLHDTAVLLKFKSQLCKGYTFEVTVYEGYP